jgi:adenylosuccinate synthase
MGRALIVVGLGYGDEGKGSTTDFLTRKYDAKLVFRFSGGAQAAHSVVTPDGKHHTFSQFGSGTLAGARTLLTRHMLFNPISLVSEARHLHTLGVNNPLSLINVEESALLTTPFHIAANRLRELARGQNRHGSCGMGIGETVQDALSYPDLALRASDLLVRRTLREKLEAVRERMLLATSAMRALLKVTSPSSTFERERDILESESSVEDCVERFVQCATRIHIDPDGLVLHTATEAGATIIGEGSQGVLLDEDYGFHPHTTWAHTTFKNALEALQAEPVEVTKLAVLRAYATRHGAGPFVTEDERHYGACSSHDHNTFGEWQQNFRSGALDLVAARYALDVLGPVDGLALTCLDRLSHVAGDLNVCTGYRLDDNIDPNLFDGELNRATRIRHDPKVDLDRQERITKALFTAKPIMWQTPSTNMDTKVAERLGVPVVIKSHGPTALDKFPRL